MPNPGENPLYSTTTDPPHEHKCGKCSADNDESCFSRCDGPLAVCGVGAVFPFCTHCIPALENKLKTIFSGYADHGKVVTYPRVKYIAQMGMCNTCGLSALGSLSSPNGIKVCTNCNTLHAKKDGFWVAIKGDVPPMQKPCGCNGCSGQTS